MTQDSFMIISALSFIICLLLVYWIYNINSNVQKLKKIMYAQLMVSAKLAKKDGEIIDIEALYKKGDSI